MVIVIALADDHMTNGHVTFWGVSGSVQFVYYEYGNYSVIYLQQFYTLPVLVQ